MLCVVIKGPSYHAARLQIEQAKKYAQCVELRLDYFQNIDLAELRNMLASQIPVIFTLRGRLDKGHFQGSEEDRYKLLKDLAGLHPHYLDIEHHVPISWREGIQSASPKTKWILSYHDFDQTPENLDELYNHLSTMPADVYKIALHANHAVDAMHLLHWRKNKGKAQQLIAISMGSHGQISRILSRVIHNPFTYACFDNTQAPAPGQLPAEILANRFNCLKHGSHTAVYGLIGDPVHVSISDETHNHLFLRKNLDAVYVKIPIQKNELKPFLALAKQLSFKGLSVTMPWKETILDHLDGIDPEAKTIGAVNTLVLKDNQWIGFNTDGIGAMNAIEKKLGEKKRSLLILGAGGTAKAIAHEAKKRNFEVTIFNRNEQKAQELARKLNCQFTTTLKGTESHLMINCTAVEMPISADLIPAHSHVMDIHTKPLMTEFLHAAQKKGCTLIHGYEMFIEQAIGQFKLWFPTHPDHCRAILTEKAQEVLKQELS